MIKRNAEEFGQGRKETARTHRPLGQGPTLATVETYAQTMPHKPTSGEMTAL